MVKDTHEKLFDGVKSILCSQVWRSGMRLCMTRKCGAVCCVCGYQQLLVNVVYGLRLVLHEILTKIAEHMKHFMTI